MAISLTQSDLIAMGIGIAQVIATVGIGIWAVSRSAPKEVRTSQSEKPRGSLLWQFVRETWFLWLFAAYGAYELTSLASEEGFVTQGDVVRAVFFGAYTVFNILLAITYWGINRAFEIMGGILKVQHDMLNMQGQMIGLQEDASTAQKSALTRGSTRTRRKRAGARSRRAG